jgi:hypothetical protein
MRYLIPLVLLAQPAAALPILVNGSFDDLIAPTQNISGPFTIAGWTGQASSQGGNAGLVHGPDNGLTPYEGPQHYTFNGGNPSDQGWIQQTLPTTPGAQYLLTFALGRAGGLQDLSLRVTAGSSEWSATPPWSRSYQTYEHTFTAADASTTLRFTDTSGPNSISDIYLDAVSITEAPNPSARPAPTTHPVPETGATILLTLGALLLLLARQPRA